jgi:alpha-tubulin suppressor-like RCC1 family protein
MTLVNKSRRKDLDYSQNNTPDIPSASDGDITLNNYEDRSEVFSDTLDKWIPLSVVGTDYRFGGLWVWGYNALGDLGLNDTITRSSPVQLNAVQEWQQIKSGVFHKMAIKIDGTLWAWGDNFTGALGLGDTNGRSSPIQVGALTNWVQISCGNGFSLAIKTDGTLWSWGYNFYGQLGQNDFQVDRWSPTQVGNLTNWSQVSAGTNGSSAAVKKDGTLWAWGYNQQGQLGQSNRIYRSSPTQIGSLSNWSKVIFGYNYFMAFKIDGTLWACGRNTGGQLGQLDVINRSSPVQVGALTTWENLAIGQYQNLALMDNGTLWSWGENPFGQLGILPRIPRSSPTQIGTLTTWYSLGMTAANGTATTSYGIKTDGTLWAWGYGSQGELCQSDRNHRSSPVQIGSLTTWVQIQGGSGSILAVMRDI